MIGSKEFMPLLKKYERSSVNQNVIKIDPISPERIQEYKSQGIDLSLVSEESNLLIASLAHNKNITKSQIKLLKKIGANILELDVGHSNFNDAFAYVFGHMPHLKKIGLQHSAISNKSLTHLKGLKYLEYLNLYNTRVNDQSVSSIVNIPNLKNIYLWKSNFTQAGVEQLKKELPLLAISYNIDEDIFGKSELKAPKVIAEQFIFQDSVLVDLKSNFPKVKKYYTTDGSIPDSNSRLFTAPLKITTTTQLKFFSRKAGWRDSPVDSTFFLKGTNGLSRVNISPKPNSSYPGLGSASLFDLKKGSTNFRDGNWLGYQGQDFFGTFTFEKEKNFQKIYVSTLANQPSWIFFPKGFKVWISNDGKDFKLIKTMTFPPVEQNDATRQRFFKIDIPNVAAKYLKIQVMNQGKNPAFHASPGEASWVFVDEIVIE